MTVNPFKGQDPASRIHAKINRLGVRTSQLERRITGAAAVTNDWALGQVALGTVADGTPVDGAFSSITYQTDDGSVFGIDTSGPVDSIQMLAVGSYLVRARATFGAGHTGTVQLQAVIGGPVTTYDYDTRAGGTFYSDIGPGEVNWEQVCVVNDLSAPAGAYIDFTQNTGAPRVSCVGFLQIFRLT